MALGQYCNVRQTGEECRYQPYHRPVRLLTPWNCDVVWTRPLAPTCIHSAKAWCSCRQNILVDANDRHLYTISIVLVSQFQSGAGSAPSLPARCGT